MSWLYVLHRTYTEIIKNPYILMRYIACICIVKSALDALNCVCHIFNYPVIKLNKPSHSSVRAHIDIVMGSAGASDGVY